jgi:2-keto-4-pentenoate hydratase/2-oxohepta-3-ene-1,7-dioic acid hydratase in catechol pathway
MTVRLVVTEQGIGRLNDDTIELLDTEFADLSAALDAGAELGEVAQSPVRSTVPLEGTRLRAPLPRPRQLWAVGLNYLAHVNEVPTASPLSEPFIFPKATSAIVGPGDPIIVPPVADDSIDFEGEMALVIGRQARDIPAADAWDVVAGITICNDVSWRTAQKGGPGVRANISMAKSLDTFAPLGPAVALTSSFENLGRLQLRTWVDDELRQSASTEEMIFSVPELIAFLTARVTLHPGDIIATGTPEGVGDIDGRFLKNGSVVRIELEGVGTLINRVRVAGRDA